MSDSHKGGCFCGAVRYETVGEPMRVSLCHCRYCQLRTGTAFGIGVYFNSEQITFNEGATDTYSYETESGATTELSRAQSAEQQFLGRFLQVPLAIWSRSLVLLLIHLHFGTMLNAKFSLARKQNFVRSWCLNPLMKAPFTNRLKEIVAA